MKHRIHAAIDRYGLQVTSISDLFGVKGRVYIDATLDRLPPHTAAMIGIQLTSLDQLEAQIEEIQDRIAAGLKPSPEIRLLRTIPASARSSPRSPSWRSATSTASHAQRTWPATPALTMRSERS